MVADGGEAARGRAWNRAARSWLPALALAAVIAAAAVACGRGSATRSQILFLTDRDGDWALYAMGPDGAGAHRVLAAGRVDPFGGGVGFGEPNVSPDGRRVLIERRGVTVASLDTGASRWISPGEEAAAAWSPDSTRVVFSGREGIGLYVADVRSGRKRTLLRRSFTGSPAWSPDGKWIAFDRQIGFGPSALYLVHPDGSSLMRLSRFAADGPPAWSRDGRLAYIGSRGNVSSAHLIVIDVARRKSRVVAPRLGGGADAAWSPDGRRIAYAATTGDSDVSALYTLNADGSGRRRLTPSWPPAADYSPAWSPDGESLLFVRVPLGGGAERYVPQVWTMRVDGSHRRPLTRAYPNGGQNLEPHWVRGRLHAEPRPRPRELRRGDATVLEVPYPVDGVAAEAGRAAITPLGHGMEHEFLPTPPVLVWRPGHGDATPLNAFACGEVDRLVLSGSRVAFDCNNTFFEQVADSLWVVDLRTRIPREVFFAHGGVSARDSRGTYLDNVVGGAGLLAFGSERVNARGSAVQRTLWRIDGLDSVALDTGAHTGNLVAAGAGRLALALARGRVALTTTDGATVRILRVPSDATSQFLVGGGDLFVLTHRMLRSYDAATGTLRWERRVPSRAALEAADGRVVVYTAATSIHVLAHGRDHVIHTAARMLPRPRRYVLRPLHATLAQEGLYYCFDVADPRYPGRVVFVPRSALPR